MANDVTHKLTFAQDKAEAIFAWCCPNGRFDFKTLVPQPPHLYFGPLSSEDVEDFPANWKSWCLENWGTKWNAYSQAFGLDNGKAFITFDTAWSIPYPVLAAFANKFCIPFEHRYYDELHNFWGIEVWERNDGYVYRAKKRQSCVEDQVALRIELKGYNPENNLKQE